jgi:hypothetical protein
MIYDTKTAVVLRAGLLGWQQVNVAAFLAGGLAGAYPVIVGEAYRDADGGLYTPLLREPVFVYGADPAALARTRQRAIGRNLRIAVYPMCLFATSNDDDNRAAVAALPAAAMDLAGIGLHADRKTVDKVVNGLKFLA